MEKRVKKNSIIGMIFLLLAALSWGISYSALKLGVNSIPSFAFVGVRHILGALVVLPFALKNNSRKGIEKKEYDNKYLIKAGIICGTFLATGFNIFSLGITHTSVSKAGFISALYIIVIPIVGLILGKKVEKRIWISVVIAVIGFYFLCLSESFSMSRGDFIVVLSMFGFAAHIMSVGHFSPRVDGVKLACLQFFVCGVISIVISLFTEAVTLEQFKAGLLPLLYSGIIASGGGYTFQVIGQSRVSSTRAGLILSLESVFSAVGGYFILHDTLTTRELLGCVIVFCGVILSQTTDISFRKKDACKD